jgi:hypothetical protein
MSSNPTFLAAHRALSPLVQPMSDMGLAAQSQLGAAGAAQSAAAGSAARAHTILGASSVEEVMAMVTNDYADVLRKPIYDVAKYVKHRLAAETAVEKLQKHIASSSYPSALTAKGPTLQLSGGFADSQEGRAFYASNEGSWKAYRDAQVAEWLRARKDEVQFYTKALKPEVFFGDLKALLTDRYQELRAQRMLPVYAPVEGETEPTITWEVDPSLKLRFDEVVADSVQFMYRVVSIFEQRDRMEKRKSVAKVKVSQDADIEMGEITASSSDIQSRIDKAVAAAIKSRPVAGSSKAPYKGKIVSLPTPSPASILTRFIGKGPAQDDFVVSAQRQVFGTAAGTLLRSTAVAHPAQAHQASGKEDYAGPRQGQEGHQGERTISLSDDPSSWPTFRYVPGHPSSIPDWVLTLDYRRALSCIIRNTTPSLVDSLKFMHHVHTSPGVSLPKELSYHLSVGLKYMFPTQQNSNLIKKSWYDFVRRVRWRIHFGFTHGEDAVYDPDYDVRKPSKKQAPQLPLYIELGLKAGQRFVLNTIANIPPTEVQENFNAFTPDIRRLKEFMLSSNYVVTMTDKNLGLAVSEREWIIEKSLALLSNALDYRELPRNEADAILRSKCKEMEELADDAFSYIDMYEGSVSEFMRSKVTAPTLDATHNIPVFYSIPKIHKTPVKGRPIIPCHSAIMNPAAKYVSKRLKPLIKAAPTILHGTKDLAIKLSKLTINTSRRWFIVTGDVVAYYPNIPLDACIDIVYNAYKVWFDAHDDREFFRARHLWFFREALRIGNSRLITQFQDKTYEQLRGLAMGVADSPDLANLYGCHFEEKSKVLDDPSIPFYGRYIDDCLAIVYATDEISAVKYMEDKIRFDGCVIEWSASRFASPFLDMELYVDQGNQLQHMPYRKARNHMERIPWVSHHPLDVKRGTFVGEMSRLATLCSLQEHYTESMRALVSLYVVRGYPEVTVMSWLRSHYKERWEKRLFVSQQGEKSANTNVLVLKTEFNTAWNYFSASELGDTILKYWREWLERCERREFSLEFPRPSDTDFAYATSVQPGLSLTHTSVTESDNGDGQYIADVRKLSVSSSRMITSRKRTRNLLDLTNLWKRVVLESIDEQAAVEPVVSISDNNVRVVTPEVVGTRNEVSDDEDTQYIHRRSSSPTPTQWRLARM